MSNSKNDNYGSRFLYSEDLIHGYEYTSPVMEITAIHPPNSLKSADGRNIDKPSLSFAETPKMLVLCKTNIGIIHTVVGEEIGEGWIGAKIKLAVREVKAFGDLVPAIRVIPPTGTKIRKGLKDRLGSAISGNFADRRTEPDQPAQQPPAEPTYDISGNEITWRGQTVAVENVNAVVKVIDRCESGNRRDGDVEFLKTAGFAPKKGQ